MLKQKRKDIGTRARLCTQTLSRSLAQSHLLPHLVAAMAFLAKHFALLVLGHGLRKLVAVDDLRLWLESRVRVCCRMLSVPLFRFFVSMCEREIWGADQACEQAGSCVLYRP